MGFGGSPRLGGDGFRSPPPVNAAKLKPSIKVKRTKLFDLCKYSKYFKLFKSFINNFFKDSKIIDNKIENTSNL